MKCADIYEMLLQAEFFREFYSSPSFVVLASMTVCGHHVLVLWPIARIRYRRCVGDFGFFGMNISFFGLALGKNEQYDIRQLFFLYLTVQVRRCLSLLIAKKKCNLFHQQCTRSIFRLINNSSIHGTIWSEAFFFSRSTYKYISRLRYSKSFVYTT